MVLMARCSTTLLVPSALLNSGCGPYTRNGIMDKEKKEGRKEKKINKEFKLGVGGSSSLHNDAFTSRLLLTITSIITIVITARATS